MKLNVDVILKDLDGNELKDGEKSVTLKSVIVNALTMLGKNDESMTGPDKFVLYTIAQVVHKGGDIELTAEEIVKIKERVGKFYTPIVVGNVFNLLENKEIK